VPSVDRLGGASISGANLRAWEGPVEWPYTPHQFVRDDESDDSHHYAEPSFVTHVDAEALRALTRTYAAFFASALDHAKGTGRLAILDTASSWRSHYPELPVGTRVAVQGLNADELAANHAATEQVVVNLNDDPSLPYASDSFDIVTNAASVGYLTRPRETFTELHRVLKPGGVAIVSFSNRVFDRKATRLWLDKMDEEVALCSVVRNYFYFGPVGGWQNVSSADVSPHPSRGDPLWIVTAVKSVKSA